jgi:hypothetical protein
MFSRLMLLDDVLILPHKHFVLWFPRLFLWLLIHGVVISDSMATRDRSFYGGGDGSMGSHRLRGRVEEVISIKIR